jgi:hypothetical protein
MFKGPRLDIILKDLFLNFARLKARLSSYITIHRKEVSFSPFPISKVTVAKNLSAPAEIEKRLFKENYPSPLHKAKLSLAENLLDQLNAGTGDLWGNFYEEHFLTTIAVYDAIKTQLYSRLRSSSDELDKIIKELGQLKETSPSEFYEDIPFFRKNYILFLDVVSVSLLLTEGELLFFVPLLDEFFLFDQMQPILQCPPARAAAYEERKKYMQGTLQACQEPKSTYAAFQKIETYIGNLISSKSLSFQWKNSRTYTIAREIGGNGPPSRGGVSPLLSPPISPSLPPGYSSADPLRFLGPPRVVSPKVSPRAHALLSSLLQKSEAETVLFPLESGECPLCEKLEEECVCAAAH